MQGWGKAFREHRNLTIYTFLSVVYVIVVALINGAKPSDFFIFANIAFMTALSTVCAFWLLVCFFFSQAVVTGYREKSGKRGIELSFSKRLDAFINNGLITSGLVGIIPLYLIGVSVDTGKSLIVYLNTYHWDPVFSHIDKAIHFGHYPHEFLVPLVTHLHLAWLMNASYLIWFLVMFMTNAYCLFCDQNTVRRKRYLWTLVLSWTLIGMALATIFASGGPIFFHDFYPKLDNPYATLIAHLKSVNDAGTELNVIHMSPYLLEMARNSRVMEINGPSAMPSMHVAIAWLIVLYTWSINRRAGIAAFVYFLIILAGSVYLSWHYAIDGYAAVVLSSLIWFSMGRIFRETAPVPAH